VGQGLAQGLGLGLALAMPLAAGHAVIRHEVNHSGLKIYAGGKGSALSFNRNSLASWIFPALNWTD